MAGCMLPIVQHFREGSPCHQGHSMQVCEAVRAVAREALPWDGEIPVFRNCRSTKRRSLWILHQQTEVEVPNASVLAAHVNVTHDLVAGRVRSGSRRNV